MRIHVSEQFEQQVVSCAFPEGDGDGRPRAGIQSQRESRPRMPFSPALLLLLGLQNAFNPTVLTNRSISRADETPIDQGLHICVRGHSNIATFETRKKRTLAEA